MVLSSILLIAGLVLLIKGADWFVEGASSLAKKYNISDLAIGLTIVAFGTSAPELVVNAVSSLDGLDDVVLGNVIGSSNFNLFIILGIAGLISPLLVESNTVKNEIPLSIIAFTILLLLANGFFLGYANGLVAWKSFVLFFLFAIFLFSVYRQLKNDDAQPDLALQPRKNWVVILLLIGGLLGLIFGGRLAVDNAVSIATTLGWSEKVIGLTVLAAGTSLPELATSVIAATKGNNNIAVGNVIGSNLFNLLFILAVSVMIDPVTYPISFNTDMIILIAGTLFLFLILRFTKGSQINRTTAFVLLAFYLAYTAYLVFQEM